MFCTAILVHLTDRFFKIKNQGMEMCNYTKRITIVLPLLLLLQSTVNGPSPMKLGFPASSSISKQNPLQGFKGSQEQPAM